MFLNHVVLPVCWLTLFFFLLNCFALHETHNFSAFFGKNMIVLTCGFSLNGLHMFAHKMSVMKESTKFTWWNSIRAREKQNKQQQQKTSPSSKNGLIDAKGSTEGGNGVSKEELEKIWTEAHKSAAIQLCQELQWEILITGGISTPCAPMRALLGQPWGKHYLVVTARPGNQHSWILSDRGCWLTQRPWVSHSLPAALAWPCQGATNEEAKQTYLGQCLQTGLILPCCSFSCAGSWAAWQRKELWATLGHFWGSGISELFHEAGKLGDFSVLFQWFPAGRWVRIDFFFSWSFLSVAPLVYYLWPLAPGWTVSCFPTGDGTPSGNRPYLSLWPGSLCFSLCPFLMSFSHQSEI